MDTSRWIVALLVLGACGADERSRPDAAASVGPDAAASAYACGEPMEQCRGRLCITQTASFGPEDCCDSWQCNCNPVSLQWETWYCEQPPQPDAAVDAAAIDGAVDAP